VNRDLKPENLLEKTRSDDIHVLLADFGLACIIGTCIALLHDGSRMNAGVF
jgi:serine/threonine protein kinase